MGSWDKKQIVKVSLKDKTHSTIPTKYSGKLNGMGTFLKKNLLYAVMNEVDDDPNIKAISVLLVIDTNSDNVLQAYESTAKNGRNHFNHVVVDNNGVAYISNTLQSSIHTVDTKNPKDSLKIFFEHKDLSFVHGIDLNNNGEKLFTTAYDGGIRFLDIKTKQFYSFRDTTLNANDGLKYYKGDLYGVGKNAIKKYALNKEENKVIKVDTLLIDHPFFNDPRCLHIQNDFLFCLANIEFEPVIFPGGIRKKRKKALDDTYLIKLKLE
ncbi:hypothetical protein [Aquimarina sp. Aq107]|uniref:hypothetical protein n=1 Tax=Aquimarina sp. Aq107 TaxID=1191912 RepID=UPI000D5544CD|nr:hypothetical protein [Aquimarina sp. Aq107]